MTLEKIGALETLAREVGQASQCFGDPAALRRAAERIETVAREVGSAGGSGIEAQQIVKLRSDLDVLAERLRHREAVLGGFGAYLRSGAERG